MTHSLLAWFDQHGRKNLPWQQPRTPYRVFISEIMLQQTQVKTVIPYFLRFMEDFPTLHNLANASEDKVLARWSGLGYYSRARHLHKAAKIIEEHFNGLIPDNVEQLRCLPGIGPSTAAAIASLAFDKPTAILDGNVKRVLSRYFLIGNTTLSPKQLENTLWQRANECLSYERAADYTQAIMDLGATCCTVKSPDCIHCPLASTCQAKKEGMVNQYPIKKPKKTLPVKQEQFLLLYTKESRIYLEQRPPTGLWGGLWCLPSVLHTDCAITYVKNTYAPRCLGTPQSLLTIKHSFSHFHLYIHALSIAISSPFDGTMHNGHWFLHSEIETVGIAKPVHDIIQSFFT